MDEGPSTAAYGTNLMVALDVGAGDARLSLVGELDLATGQIFVSALAAVLRRRPETVVLDLRRLTFIDARGVGAIVSASRRAALWGGTLSLNDPQPAVRRVFDLCLLDDLLDARGFPGGPGSLADGVAPSPGMPLSSRADAA